ncbi:phytanoyl-CoA dioxygenase family protein [Planktomarina temperata]|uniref:phytanoyl-CoA dioxygenase family protein n=1 Tax=Planktomarina temperata TaxID=1284658 RepID=UPI00146CF154
MNVVLQPGQVALHHCLLAHASGPNRTHGAVRQMRTRISLQAQPNFTRPITGATQREQRRGSA